MNEDVFYKLCGFDYRLHWRESDELQNNFQQSFSCQGCLRRKTILKEGKKPTVSFSFSPFSSISTGQRLFCKLHVAIFMCLSSFEMYIA